MKLAVLLVWLVLDCVDDVTVKRGDMKDSLLETQHQPLSTIPYLKVGQKTFCQPGDSCWPTPTATEQLRADLLGDNLSCLKLKRLVTVYDLDAHKQLCLNYTGLQNSKQVPNNAVIYKANPPNCDTNPFASGAYKLDNGTSCMTPYQFLNNRNYHQPWSASFIVTAETIEDVQIAVKFAASHNLGLAVMSTGHGWNDRNAGPGPNSLLIRTTCFQDWSAHPNQPILAENGSTWTDGYADVGAGLTFGLNFWTELQNSVGTYKLAAEVDRLMVGGSCLSVGVVGFSIGGGHGWLSPQHGLGADNILHADIVIANGSFFSANNTHNKDLFYAVQGGGFGFGVITSIKYKLHRPRCNDSLGNPTMENCVTMWNTTWHGQYVAEEGKTKNRVVRLLEKYFSWTHKRSKYWSSKIDFSYEESSNSYTFNLWGFYFGTKSPENSSSLFNTFEEETEDRAWMKSVTGREYWCNIFPDLATNTSCGSSDKWQLGQWRGSIRFTVNQTVSLHTKWKGLAFGQNLLEFWKPYCDTHQHYEACTTGYAIASTFPGDKFLAGPISPGLRDAAHIVFNLDVVSSKKILTHLEREKWMHFTLAPALYKYSDSSYFNEPEYSLNDGDWENRFWGKENHQQLLSVKKTWDPTKVFLARHCVGSENENEESPKQFHNKK